MKVLFISRTDWANVGGSLAKCLNSVGVEAVSVCKRLHKHHYGDSSIIYKNEKELRDLIDKHDIIQFMHSEYIETGHTLKDKCIVVYHGGSDYRIKHKELLKFWNGKAKVHLIQTADLLGLGAEPEEWFLPPVDTDRIRPNYKRTVSGKKVIMHCPSNPHKKGTKEFNVIIDKLKDVPTLKDKFIYEYGHKINWTENIKRKSTCDVYFDACKPILEGKPYGFWGIAALESAALGKIVITHFNHNQEEYVKRYGPYNLKIANSMDEVERQIVNHILMDDKEFKVEQKKTREWVVKNHSMKVTGQRLVDIYNKYF